MIGTTFKGAVDDHPAILEILRKKNPPAVYVMLDAALFGGYLPYSPFRDIVNRQKTPFDAIAVSGHKFFGFDKPLGLFITTNERITTIQGLRRGRSMGSGAFPNGYYSYGKLSVVLRHILDPIHSLEVGVLSPHSCAVQTCCCQDYAIGHWQAVLNAHPRSQD